eukprot:XP_001700500.1 predicted protein [Chlamydomonas reinhardtii]
MVVAYQGVGNVGREAIASTCELESNYWPRRVLMETMVVCISSILYPSLSVIINPSTAVSYMLEVCWYFMGALRTAFHHRRRSLRSWVTY